MQKPEYDAIVIGGGFFGCRLALSLTDHTNTVAIIEREDDLLQRASYANQARVHNGYHYPRSLLTGLRSRVNFERFVTDYKECIYDGFDKYYGIGKISSKVSAAQFKAFCKRIGAPIELAPKEIKKLFNPGLIEEVFKVKEYAFDAVKLKDRMMNDLDKKEIEVRTGSKVIKVSPAPTGRIEVLLERGDETEWLTAKQVFNCTYSQMNQILAASHLPVIPLKYELAEMALIEMPAHLKNIGITVMCGPFFSTMPFPPVGFHTLSHVRYTPHHWWQDVNEQTMDTQEYFKRVPRKTNYPHMIKDATRYIPSLEGCRYVASLWEVKTVLPLSEADDSRPILFRKDHGLQNLTCVMGGKIDNIYDVLSEIESLSLQGGFR